MLFSFRCAYAHGEPQRQMFEAILFFFTHQPRAKLYVLVHKLSYIEDKEIPKREAATPDWQVAVVRSKGTYT